MKNNNKNIKTRPPQSPAEQSQTIGKGFIGSNILALAIIILLAVIVYSGTLNSPFIWDEEPLITNNSLVHSLDYYTNPSSAIGHPRYDGFSRRYVSYLTYALNYAHGGTEVSGYHIVNISIHAVTACLLYMLVLVITSTPVMSGSSVYDIRRELALLSAAVFAVHPLMTEAVTYVFQRQASMVAMLYIMTVVLYGAARNKQNKALYIASIITAVIAMKTKENAFTVPVIIALYEFMFYRDKPIKRIVRLAPMALTMLIIPLNMTHLSDVIKPASTDTVKVIIPLSEQMLSRAEYLYTQMPIILKYLGMLILPINQNIDHAYMVYSSPLNPSVIIAAIFHMAMILGAVWLWRRSRAKTTGGLGLLAAFGIFWFYITLSVESSIVPLPMIITEYRAYLPVAGLLPAIIAVLMTGYAKLDRRKTLLASKGVFFSIIIILILGWAALMRNELWATQLSIWQDSADKSPTKARPFMHVGVAHEKLKNYDQALIAYMRAVELEPDHYMAQYDVGAILNMLGKFNDAEPYFREALRLNPKNYGSMNNLATILLRRGQTVQAERYLDQVLANSPNNSNALYNITLIMLNGKRYTEALPLLVRLNGLMKPNPDVMSKLGMVYRETGQTDKARQVLTESIKRFPGDHWAVLNLGILEENQDNMMQAERLYNQAIKLAGNKDYVPMAALARLYIKTNRFYDGLDLINEAQIKFPKAKEINDLRMYIYNLMGGSQ